MEKYTEFKKELSERVEKERVHCLASLLMMREPEDPREVVKKIWNELVSEYLPDDEGKYPKIVDIKEQNQVKVEFPDGSLYTTNSLDQCLRLWDEYLEKKNKKSTTRVRGFEPVKGAPADTKIPTRGTSKSAGYDFYAPEDIVVPPRGYSKIVFLNVKAYMPDDEFLGLAIRSSMATTLESVFDDKGKVVKPESHLITAQGLCVIDSDYYSNADNDGNIGVMFYNFGDKPRMIKKGERCCQGIFMKYGVADNDVSQGVREGGYGSTGK